MTVIDPVPSELAFVASRVGTLPDGTGCYVVELRWKGRRFTTDFFQGSAMEEGCMAPTLDRVVHALQIECVMASMSYRAYLYWVGTPDSPALRLGYAKAQGIRNGLRKLFADDFDMFLSIEEPMI